MPAVLANGFAIGALAVPEHNTDHRDFAQMGVRYADRSAIKNRRMRENGILDFGGSDVLPTSDDQFLQPAGDGQKTIPVTTGEIAGVIPASPECFGRFRWLI
ncbi:hypothetical protein D3C87_1809500 [compost metagenome]